MKKVLLTAVIAVLGFTSATAQGVEFGVTAGYLGAYANASFNGQDIDIDSEGGFYIGGLADFEVSEEFHVQPSLVYANINDGSGLILPIMAKYYVADAFSVQAGPQLDITLEDLPDDFSGFGISIAAGLGYDIDENFFVEARYGFQVNDYYTGDADIESKSNTLMIGVGYKFN